MKLPLIPTFFFNIQRLDWMHTYTKYLGSSLSDFTNQTHDYHSEERRAPEPVDRLLGHVVLCTGSRIEISTSVGPDDIAVATGWSVGRLVTIVVDHNRVVALVSSMETPNSNWDTNGPNTLQITAELVGEVRQHETHTSFSTGITRYPHLGAVAHDIRAEDLKLIYDAGTENPVVIGKLSQNQDMDATICIPSMLSRHFALVGTTGVGKSTALSLLVNKAIQSDPQLRVLILDLHDEFASAFNGISVAIGPDTLDLPFWLFKFEEFAEVVFRGQPKVTNEMNALRDLIGEAKRAFKGDSSHGLSRKRENKSFTADTPVPYRIADLLARLDDRIGRLDGKSDKPHLMSLKIRIQSAISNPRYGFMFSSSTISDTIMQTIGTIFRIPADGKPLTTLQLAGIPSEVVDSVASVLCRMAFEIALWSEGAVKILVVCEEAHRYISSDPTVGFLPTRQAISRIAKEGRKYGVSLGIITQRPGELDPTILSQCSTVFAMRLANDRDQEIIRSALPNSSSSTTSFLASIGNGEAIAFGEAVTIPMRMMFERIPQSELPSTAGISENIVSSLNLSSIVEKMRSTEGGKKSADDLDFVSMDGLADAPTNSIADTQFRSARLASEKKDAAQPANRLRKLVAPASAPADSSFVKSVAEKPSGSDDLQREMSELRARLLGK